MTYCGERAFELILPEGTSSFLSFDEDTKTLHLQSNNESDVDHYQIALRIYLTEYPEVEKTSLFTISILICDMSVVVSSMTYRIGNPTLTGGNYDYFVSHACDGFEQKIDIVGLPSFVTHNEDDQNFTIHYTEDVSLSSVYTVTISSVILIPDFPL